MKRHSADFFFYKQHVNEYSYNVYSKRIYIRALDYAEIRIFKDSFQELSNMYLMIVLLA